VDHDTAGELLGAYALNACDQAEMAAIEVHLLGCSDCRVELSGIQRVSWWLGASETVTPPRWLRAHILQEAQRDTAVLAERRRTVEEDT